MEWNKIESKWNEMAGRLQNKTQVERRSSILKNRISLPDAVSQPISKSETDAAATDAGRIATRSAN